MHPILARGGRLALYLAAWMLVGPLLAAVLAGQEGLSWPRALAVALPVSTMYAFLCLSAWYVARSMPLATSGIARGVITALAAASITSAASLALARVWIDLAGRGGPARAAPARFGGIDSLIF